MERLSRLTPLLKQLVEHFEFMDTSMYGVKRERVEETSTNPSRQKRNSMPFCFPK